MCACDWQEFKAEHGHTNVPQEYWKNPSLGNWVKYNRKKLREWHSNGSSDDMEKMTLLIEIGVVSYIGECCHGSSAKFMLVSSTNSIAYACDDVL